MGVILAATLIGPAPVNLLKVVRYLKQGSEKTTDVLILWEVRLPRVLLAGVVGAALAVVGGVLQALVRNPLADPHILGISGGASLGAVIALALKLDRSLWGFSTVPLFAFLGALATLGIVYILASTQGRMAIYTLLLTGVVLNAFFSAVMMLLIAMADLSTAQNMMVWLMGGLNSLSYKTVGITFLYAGPGIFLLLLLSHRFNLLSLGEEAAQQLGVDVERTKKITFITTSLVTGSVVAVSGPIGFVGLIIPHAIRLLLGPDHRLLLPASFFAGAIFLIGADTAARSLMAPTELPVGVLTSLCGAPFFLWLIRRPGNRPKL